MKKILSDRSFYLSIVITLIFFGTGILFLILGFADLSWILFILLPVVLGFTLASIKGKIATLAGAVITTILVLTAMYVPGLSGLLCIVMTLPLIIPVMFLAFIITHLVRRYRDIKDSERLPVLLLPLITFLVMAPTEHFMKKDKEAVMEVRSEIVFNYSPEQVYDAIKSVDTIVGIEKPYLMAFDLPIPRKCVLEKEAVGGIRTCYFNGGELSNADFGGGTITEKITEIERGRILKMDVTDYNLIGRKWLGFKEAIYTFERSGEHGCKMTRVTTYTSVLTPRAYWEPMEKLGIRQEHEYIFNYLESTLTKKYNN